MHRRESYIEAKVVEHARKIGYLARKVQYPGKRGAPDHWFFGPTGQIVIIEFKDPNGALSVAQRREIAKLRERGLSVHVIDSIEVGKALLEHELRKAR